jgi:hypothetical protein
MRHCGLVWAALAAMALRAFPVGATRGCPKSSLGRRPWTCGCLRSLPATLITLSLVIAAPALAAGAAVPSDRPIPAASGPKGSARGFATGAPPTGLAPGAARALSADDREVPAFRTRTSRTCTARWQPRRHDLAGLDQLPGSRRQLPGDRQHARPLDANRRRPREPLQRLPARAPPRFGPAGAGAQGI